VDEDVDLIFDAISGDSDLDNNKMVKILPN
jgi:hypothetical protein